jgi:hypothetical protein
MAVAMLAGAGLLLQACSDNKGPVGPRNPSSTTGFANTAAEIRVQVAINPNSITPGRRAGVTVLVTNLNGQPLAGKKVQLSVDIGSLDQNFGVTNGAGQFSTFVRISSEDVTNAGGSAGSATVTAFVEGAIGTGTVTFGGNPTPLALAIIPSSVERNFGANTGGPPANQCNPFSVTVQFTVTGGTPPYTFSTTGSWPGATVNGSGLYTGPDIGPQAVNTSITDTVTVKDSTGSTASATLKVSCTPPPGP